MDAKYYAGIGSRKTPDYILQLMKEIATKLESRGWTLRSGGAEGADDAFESGCTRKQIYVPWNGFNNRDLIFSIPDNAYKLAEEAHPNWKALSQGAKTLMARNCMQVLGKDLNEPSKFVLCWTPDGCVSHATRSYRTGGTGQAITIADKAGIRVFNLASEEHYYFFKNFIESKFE